MGLGDDGLLLGDIILLVGILPSTFYLVDYGILRWLIPRIRKTKHIEAWYDSLTGWMLFLLGLGFWSFQVVILIQRLNGNPIPLLRDLGYAITTLAAFTLCVVWLILKRQGRKTERPR